uniref:Alternative protein n=1 Tax=Macrostomum lignano TaxID=282301 RepID=A0A1I8ICS0_9PLAT
MKPWPGPGNSCWARPDRLGLAEEASRRWLTCCLLSLPSRPLTIPLNLRLQPSALPIPKVPRALISCRLLRCQACQRPLRPLWTNLLIIC